ncbi:MAG: tRNA (adenosine(37)-N6)-threonylcarbamoyltransferase complex dimerization subunit type 1 TsaB [Pikeienuella sp.]|uniref:tRNA (adenosine(37)-N6)-threonylcarbamoyltransferase complex dimerization subunit type 1 TsaB n=1 Tax=Pikeienuella sp. TaxID=2831957 RepID=UPI00391BF58B
MPLILAFDTAAGRCAAAVFDGARRLAGREEIMARGHDSRLFPMIDEALAEAGRGYGDLDLVAVGTGPGNFTGARLAVSAARGLALSTGAEAVGVDRFAALAEGRRGIVCAALLAPGGMLHVARFEGGAEVFAATLRPEEGGAAARGALVLGDGAAALVSATGEGEAGDGLEAPLDAYAAAALRLRGAAPRPTPRYLRPPAAAPMAPPPPMIG